MITKSAENNVRKAIKARLKLNNKQISDLLLHNWNVPAIGDMNGCIAVCEPKKDAVGEYELIIMMKDREGYFTTVHVYELEEQHVARWKLLPLEEAYALPADYAHRGSSGVWHNAKIIAVATDEIDRVLVVAEVDGLGVEGAETLTLRTEDYVEDIAQYQAGIGRIISLCIDMSPPKTEKHILSGKDPLPLIVSWDQSGVYSDDDSDIYAVIDSQDGEDIFAS